MNKGLKNDPIKLSKIILNYLLSATGIYLYPVMGREGWKNIKVGQGDFNIPIVQFRDVPSTPQNAHITTWRHGMNEK